jgi:demethylmenaquinone methyltransferase / 2-methoxy-6-polyprenyl-1,4-benzoquinol methylase
MRAGLGTEQLRDLYRRLARRYDGQHAFLTARSDERGRALLVERIVCEGHTVLDCGAGTGSTGIRAARRVGPGGRVTLFDLSEDMLEVAREKIARSRLQDRVDFRTGDMIHLPFDDGRFDVVLSTYSLCPLVDPAGGALEMYRVTRPGGRIGIAHSTEPAHALLRALAERVEDVAWRLPALSMGCRSVEVLPALERAGGRIVLRRRIGVPLWPFLVLVVEKPRLPER